MHYLFGQFRVFRRSLSFVALIAGFSLLLQAAPARAGCSATNFADAVVKIGEIGSILPTQTLNGILYTEGQIGVMADRILWTELQIGVMADRIVYVTQFSENNAILAIYAVTNLVYRSQENAGYLYTATLTQVPALPPGW